MDREELALTGLLHYAALHTTRDNRERGRVNPNTVFDQLEAYALNGVHAHPVGARILQFRWVQPATCRPCRTTPRR